MISGFGPYNSDVMLISDFAQGEDLKTGYAISGFKENLLSKFASAAGINLKDFYKTTLIKDEPPKFKWDKKKKPTDGDISRWLLANVVPPYKDTLINEINAIKPLLLVPLGETSFQFLTGLEGIRKFRGSILAASPLLGIEQFTKVLPILGPFPYLYQDEKQRFVSQLDFSKIPKWTNSQPIPDDTFKVWICRSSTELSNFLNRSYSQCVGKTLEEGGYLVFDIETYMNIPTCISFCFDGFESCCVPLIDLSIPLLERALMAQMVAKLLVSPIPKINQNIKFDWKNMERHGFEVCNIVGDTMLAASTIYADFPKNLGFLTSIYTDIPYFKDEGKEYDPAKHDKKQFYLYNAKDSLAVHQIFKVQQQEVKEVGVEFVYSSLMKLLPIYRKMEWHGIRIDEEKQNQLWAKYDSLYNIHKLALNQLVNEEGLNPLSWPACARLIFETLGYRKNQRGVHGTDEESLNVLMCFGEPKNCSKEDGKLVLQEIINCRKIHKVIEILSLDVYPDGRFRCEANLAGTNTGRTSMSETSDYFLKEDPKKPGKVKRINLGHSLQTIGKHGFRIDGVSYGKDVRDCFVPSFGYRFIEIDLSGAEARVDRVLSGNFNLEVFDNPGIHKLTGSWLFNCLPSEIKKGTMEYHLAKIFRHAGERNMGPDRAFMLAQDEGTGLSLELSDCRILLQKFHSNAPEIQQVFHRDVEKAIKVDRVLICPNGRRRDFLIYNVTHKDVNEGISVLPQAIVSDQTKFSFIPTSTEVPRAHLLVEAHDGSMWEAPEGCEREFATVYKRNIETPIDFRSGSLKRDYQLTIPSEVAIGDNWGNLEGIEL